MTGQDSLPYTDPWTVLGVHRGATRDEVKAAFRRAAMACHPDVDPSPSASARFTRIKLAADVLLKGKQQPYMPGAPRGAAAWDPAAAAAAAQRGSAGWRHRPSTLWAGLCAACALAFGYGYGWQWYVQSRQRGGAAAGADGSGARGAGGLPAMQRRKLLQALAADQAAQQRRQRQAAAGSSVAGSKEGDGRGGAGAAQLGVGTRAPLSLRALATVMGGQHHEGLGERVRHVAEEVAHVAEEAVHKAGDAVHKVTDVIHERRERAHKEAERGMFTADDITEAEELARRAHEHLPLHPEEQAAVGRSAKPKEHQPDEEEALLEEASSDVAQPYRQRELESLRNVLKEDQEPGAAGGKGGSA